MWSVMSVMSKQDRLRLMLLQSQLTENMAQNAILIEERKRKKIEEFAAETEKKKKRRTLWVRKWLQRRPQLGQYRKLLTELKKEDKKGFRNFLRMDYETYREILQRIEPRITKSGCNYRKPLSAGLKLAITLRYLAAGDNYHSLMYGFRVAHNTISILIREVCEAIIAEFAEEVIPWPTTTEEWRKISEKFSTRLNFHHCLGALDGKHIAMKCPRNGGSLYYNYKGFHSIILMALVDADYKFTWVEVGSNGSAGDAQVFNNGELKEFIEHGRMNFPPPEEPLPNDDEDMPFFIIGDDAFALRKWLMKPYSIRNMTRHQRIFNYRLSRARRIVENAFGILAHRFRCLLTTLQQNPDTVTSIVLACVCLHNMMRIRNPKDMGEVDHEDDNHNVVPGAWRIDNPLTDGISNFANNTTTQQAKLQRDYLAAYYNGEAGSVTWQDDMV